MKIKVAKWLFVRKLGKYTSTKIDSFYKNGLKWWYRINIDKWETEIFNNCIILKNIAIVQREVPLSTDYILEELKNNSKVLKSIYSNILSSYRGGQGDESFEILIEKVPTRTGRSFISILKKLDKINPAELVCAMEAFEETFSEDRITKALKRTERKSVITTMFSTASIFAILMNFAIVVVFMDTLTMLGQIF